MRNNVSPLIYSVAMRNLITTMILFTVGLVPDSNGRAQDQGSPCDTQCEYWQSKVDAELKSPTAAAGVPETDPESIVAGIECLLRMEGNKHAAKFSGATKPYVSQIFKHATADVAALYYISYLYYQKWDHADAIALRDENGEVDRPEAVRQAFESYRKWFDEVKRVGLVKAKTMKLEPLKDTKVHWY